MDFSTILSQMQSYASTLISDALGGDTTSIALVVLAIFILIGLFAGVGSLIWRYLKSILLLGIVSVSIYLTAPEIIARVSAGEITIEIILLSIVTIIAGIIALMFAFKQTKKTQKEVLQPAPTKTVVTQKIKEQKIVEEEKSLLQHLTAAKDKNLMSVISLLIIAQFGIFTSKTISAPNADVGMMLVGGFLLAAFIFIRNTYSSYKKGLAHLIVAAVAAFAISVVLGHYWGQIPLEILLSQTYFATDAAVAFITSIAVSLLMGNK